MNFLRSVSGKDVIINFVGHWLGGKHNNGFSIARSTLWYLYEPTDQLGKIYRLLLIEHFGEGPIINSVKSKVSTLNRVSNKK